MKRVILVSLILSSCGCGSTSGDFRALGVDIYQRSDYGPTREAMIVALRGWVRYSALELGTLESEMRDHLDDLVSITVRPIENKRRKDPYGIYSPSRSWIWFYWEGCKDLGVLYHELMHHYLHVAKIERDADADHSNPVWELVSPIYRAARDEFCAACGETLE